MGRGMRKIHVFGGGTALVLVTRSFATAADLPPTLPIKAPVRSAIYDWTGFYLGGHVGYGSGSFGPGTNPLPEQGVFFPHSVTGLIGGYQAGYNRQLSNRVVLGIEADASFPSPVDVPALTPAPFNTTLDYVGTVRGRIGYAFGTLLPYVTGGAAWGHGHVNFNDGAGNSILLRAQNQLGWTAGAGVEFAVSGNWTAKLEYNYIDFARRTYDLSDADLPVVNVDPNIHLVRLNYRFGDTPPWTAPVSANGQVALPATGTSTRKRHFFRWPIQHSAHPMRAQTACREADKPAKPGRRRHFSAGGSGRAASSTSTRSLRRDLA
jgi:high affinity Mn2+ porin